MGATEEMDYLLVWKLTHIPRTDTYANSCCVSILVLCSVLCFVFFSVFYSPEIRSLVKEFGERLRFPTEQVHLVFGAFSIVAGSQVLLLFLLLLFADMERCQLVEFWNG